MLLDVLKKIGLTEYEGKIYLALTEIGKSTSGQILTRAKINTGKIYDILNSLKEKGFVSEVIESGVKKFSPVDPERIYDYIEEKKKELEKQEIDLSKIIPELSERINKNNEDIKIEVYYGLKGVKSAYSKELSYGKRTGFVYILGVGSREDYPKEVYNYFVNYHQPKRESFKIKTKKIISETSKLIRKEDHEKNAKIKYLNFISAVTYSITNGLVIVGIHLKEGVVISITIESEEVSKSFIQQFELLWKIAKK